MNLYVILWCHSITKSDNPGIQILQEDEKFFDVVIFHNFLLLKMLILYKKSHYLRDLLTREFIVSKQMKLCLLVVDVARGSEEIGGILAKNTHLLSSAIGMPLIISLTLKVE
jgi:hypothetical protein